MTGVVYALSISLRFDTVQNRIAIFLSEKIEEYYDIPVKVEAIRISRLNEIELKEISLLDQQGDTILSAEKATAHISPLRIFKNEIQINTLTVAAPSAMIYRTSKDSATNIQFIIDKLVKDEDKDKKELGIKINQLLLYDGKFRYDINDSPCLEEGKLDPSHININDIRCNISLNELRSNNASLRIRSIRGREKSGLELQKFKAMIKVDGQNISLKNLDIKLPNSSITSDSICVVYDKENPKALDITGTVKSKRVSLCDIQAIFKEELPEIPEFSFTLKGEADSLSAKAGLELATHDNSINLNTDTEITLPYSTERTAKLDIIQCRVEKSITGALQPYLPGNVIETIRSVGFCDVKGDINVSATELEGALSADTGCGDIAVQIGIDNRGRYTAYIKGKEINAGKIAKSKGKATFDLLADLEGDIADIKKTTIDGDISKLHINGTTFAPISFNGSASGDTMFVEAQIYDPILRADIRADYIPEEKGGENKYLLSLRVDSLLPGRMNLRENPEEFLSFNINGDLAISPDKHHLLNAKLQQLIFRDGNSKHTLNSLHFCDNNTQEERLMMINSDFMDCSIIGEFDLGGIMLCMQEIAGKHLPALNLFPQTQKGHDHKCNYIYKCDIKQTDLLTAFLKVPVSINESSSIYGVCNDEKGIFTINTKLKGVNLRKSRFNSINIDGYSNNDKLELNAELVKAGKSKPNQTESKKDLGLNIKCVIDDNNISNDISWDNKSNPNRQTGKLRLNTELDRNTEGLLTVKTKIHQDSIINNDSIWYISGGSITGDQEKLHIKSMYLYNNEQYLKIDGTAGKNAEDSLHISAKNLDVSTIFKLINFKILQFSGHATGNGHITSLLSGPDVRGIFNVDSLGIDNCCLGQGLVDIGWDNKSKSILLDCDINDNDKISNVSGFLSPVQDTIYLAIDANDIRAGFVNKMVKSFLSDIKGVGNGKAYVLGSWRKVNLIGAVRLDCDARVTPTNVTYSIEGDTLFFYRDRIVINNIHAKDRRGNSGWLNGTVTHNNMANWACDIDIKAENLLAYDTNNFGTSPFYGTVYATGNANITANSNGVFFKAEARSEPNTRFVYNASQTGSVSDNSFVKFIDSSKRGAYIDYYKEDDIYIQTDNVNSKLNLDFMLDITEDAQIKVYTNLKSDDYLELYGKGPINAVYDEKEGFSMKGNVDVDRGTYKITVQDIFTKEFSISNGGTLAFNGDPTEVGLNIRAKYLVPSASLSDLTTETSKRKSVKVNCLMDITGTLKAPVLNFDLELPDGNEEERELLASVATTPEQKNMQFIYLLGIGKFYTYDNNNLQTGESQTSTAVESLISNTLSGQLNNMLGQIINNGNWNISGNFSTSERGWNSMEIEGMLEGRLLNNRLLINSNFGYRENPIANSNFIGDFELQWLLNKTGTVSLKAYSKTNDRYFSKTNLTTQGAGIIFRHDFNRWFWWRNRKGKNRKTDTTDKP